ncbi:hypothetical protein PoB_005750600 [Plakobranchus ocellatus]|uniref:Uncharacterized protein n=1 Tax=Plakobranchus ocellatus TaxID=259542 RepID=A0AAV4C6S3_9GAST|nr:hypothetical protein PoB_005750600 [Plakobranchus ocellatus]
MEVSLCVDSTLSAVFSEALGGWGASDSNRSVEEIEAARGLQSMDIERCSLLWSHLGTEVRGRSWTACRLVTFAILT